VPQFFAALGRELHGRAVTSLLSAELRAIYAPEIEAPLYGVSPLVENLLLLRFVELKSEVRRLISILKLRDSDFDPRIREFIISDRGLEIADPFLGEEAILTGVAHKRPGSTDPKSRARKGRRPTSKSARRGK